MVRRALLLTSIAAIACACTQRSPIRNLSDVRVHASRGITYVNDTVFNGTLVSFYPGSTDTMAISSYRSGREHGTWKKFYPGRQLAAIRTYNDGEKAGVMTSWWHNGRIKSEYHFSNNEFEGTCREWTAGGVLVRNMNYENGHEQGLQQMWDNDGSIRANYVVRNGRNYGLAGVKACATVWEQDSVKIH